MPLPFISRDDLRDYTGKDVTNDDGAIIVCDAACDTVRTFTEQEINRAVSTITVDGPGTDAIVLPQFPVNTAGTVVVNGGTVTDWVLDEINGKLLRKVTAADVGEGVPSAIVWPFGRQNVEVTYDHGYADDEIPRDIRMVALSLASRLIIQGPAVQENQAQQSVRYAGPAPDLTKTEQALLRKFRRR